MIGPIIAPGAEDRHRVAVALARIDREEGRLPERHQPGAEYALQQAKDHELAQARRRAAQRRGKREPDDRAEKDVFDAKVAGEPPGQRHRDRRGHDVRGQDPRDLVLRRRHAALDMRQRDIDDRGVEPLHDAGADDRGGDRPTIDDRRRSFSPHRPRRRSKGRGGTHLFISPSGPTWRSSRETTTSGIKTSAAIFIASTAIYTP